MVASSVLLGGGGLARIAQVAAEAVRQDINLVAYERVSPATGWTAVPMVFLMGVGLVVALAGAGLIGLAVANLGGANWTRVVTWVVGGTTLTVAAGWWLLSLVPAPDGPSPGTTDWAAVNALADQLMPGWVDPVLTTSGIVASPALLVAVVLLALPPANDFYRRRRPEPSVVVYPGATVQV